jgi:hypothetical protein
MPGKLDPGIAPTVLIADRETPTSRPPAGLVLNEELGLLMHPALNGRLLHVNRHGGLFETRATVTPGGDYLLMFPDCLPGKPHGHYGNRTEKVNNLVAYRSPDRGETWEGPTVAFDIDYNQHGFIPLIPRGTTRIYAFGTQPIWGNWSGEEDAPIGCRWSDDDGHTWSDVKLIEPANDPGFQGMSVMRMCETDAGTWLLGTHEGQWFDQPDGGRVPKTRQYILRSTDRGESWTLLPGPRPAGWYVPEFDRMDELRPISLGGGEVYAQARTCEGHLWHLRSLDDGLTWSAPEPSPLMHPDTSPMLFHLSDGETLIAFHHNVATGTHFRCEDRAQVWVALSRDGGRTWSEPRFLLVNALAAAEGDGWRDYQCSYLDMFADDGEMHIFMPHRWRRALHLSMRESDLDDLPTSSEL